MMEYVNRDGVTIKVSKATSVADLQGAASLHLSPKVKRWQKRDSSASGKPRNRQQDEEVHLLYSMT